MGSKDAANGLWWSNKLRLCLAPRQSLRESPHQRFGYEVEERPSVLATGLVSRVQPEVVVGALQRAAAAADILIDDAVAEGTLCAVVVVLDLWVLARR